MSERPSRLSPEYAAWADEKIVSLGRRVAELEKGLEEYACTGTDEPCGCYNLVTKDRARVADLVALLIEVVHCGGQCDAELLAKIERATQEEAGWTGHAVPR